MVSEVGCICISSARRTYGRIHMLPVIQTRIIILWTELFPKKRREKIQGEILQSIFEYSGVSTFYKNYSVSTRNPATPSNSTYRINSSTRILQEILQLQGSSRADQYKASSSNCSPCLQALHTAGSSYKAPYSIPGPYSTSRLPVILPGRNSILHGSQHPRSPYSSSQAHSYKNSTIGFFPKGLSIVYPIQY